MSEERTLTIIKPHAVKAKKTPAIIQMFYESGFNITALKMIRLSPYYAGKFYLEHKGKEFCEALVEMMTSGPIVVAILEKENAITDLRKLVGNTDPLKADPGTIRKLFGNSIRENAVHASDGVDNAIRECAFFFSEMERY